MTTLDYTPGEMIHGTTDFAVEHRTTYGTCRECGAVLEHAESRYCKAHQWIGRRAREKAKQQAARLCELARQKREANRV